MNKFETGKSYIKGSSAYEICTIVRRTAKSVWDSRGNRYVVKSDERGEYIIVNGSTGRMVCRASREFGRERSRYVR